MLFDGSAFGELSMMKTTARKDEDKFMMMNLNAESLEFIRKDLKKYDSLLDYEEELRKKVEFFFT